jgi:hypothetical protein
MKIYLIVILLSFSIVAGAQGKFSFSSRNYVGLLEGQRGSKFQMQTVNGLSFNTWFVGLGVGLDWYYQRSIPVFVSVSKDFLKKARRNFFLSGNGGMNFPWQKESSMPMWGYETIKLVNGIYWSAGLGYKIGIGQDAILMQIGYSYKHGGEVKTISHVIIYPIIQPLLEPTDRYDYRLQTVSIKLGYQF